MRHQGFRRLGHAALIECTCNIRPMFCLLNNPVSYVYPVEVSQDPISCANWNNTVCLHTPMSS